jgi:putative metallohydrolase (TIGR04338 family)
MRDSDRAAVYAVEDQVAVALERGGVIDFFGSTLVLPTERRFGDIASIQRYVDLVISRLSLPMRRVQPVTVRSRKGATKAHYEPAREGGTAVIAVPIDGVVGSNWAARETVVLHEITHHIVMTSAVPSTSSHDRYYRGSLVRVYREILGDEAALVLSSALAAAGLDVAQLESS